MKKLSLFLFFFLTATIASAQYSKLWKGYFSYNEVKDLSESPTKLVAASENALFSKDLLSGSIKTTNTIDGLSGLTITTIYYSPTFKKTLIGYENGLMIVINELDGSITNVVDIINKALPPGIKRINHFMEYEGIVYVSCDFGIVQYKLATMLFGDTYFIGNGGAQISVRQTTVFQGNIYAATFGNGMRWASITNANLNDFSQWTTLDANGWTGVEAFGNTMVAISNTGFFFSWDGTNFSNPVGLTEVSTDLRKYGDYLLVTTANHVYVYNTALVQIRNLNSNEITDATVKFTCATVISDKLYIGTTENGVYTTPLQSSNFQNISPAGAYRNAIFGLNASTSNLWMVYGGYDKDYNPYTYFGFQPNKFPISIYNKNGWKHIPFEEHNAKALTMITPNPNNENQVYVSSFFSGLLKVENFVPTILYNESNTGTDGLKPIGGSGPENIWVNGAAFDGSGNLWMNSSLQNKALVELQAGGQWKSFNTQSVPSSFGLFKLGRMVVDKNGTKWMATLNDGVVAFNETVSNTVFKTLRFSEGGSTGNLPSSNVRALALDNDNQLWIGTLFGLRVLTSVDAFYSQDQMTTTNIVFNEIIDGAPVAQELLLLQTINDIEVDGANNKWVATADSGVFMFSPDGQSTFYHFTTANSPLPSNTVNDLDINGATGEVFIATTKGMVSFKATATEAGDDLNNVFIYPNPVRPNYYGTVKVSGLTNKAHVKIADIEGSLVYEAISEGGTLEWDTTAFGKYKVASGVYMVFISSEDGSLTKVKKVMIVR
jgi:Two component regulator propeller